MTDHVAPLLMEYSYAVMALPPLLAGARTMSVNPPTSAVSCAIVGAPGVSAAVFDVPLVKLRTDCRWSALDS